MDVDIIRGTNGKTGVIRQENRNNTDHFATVLNAKLENVAHKIHTKHKIVASTPEPQSRAVLVGEISKEHPTVSHLLVNHPDYRKSCWKIIHSEQNRDKPYTKIEDGTKIYIDKDTGRLFWDNESARHPSKIKIEADLASTDQSPDKTDLRKPDSFSEKLINAVKQNLGVAYDQINCYELIVQGLRQLGYRYGGDGGLKESLISMAQSRGEAINTYFSGEGLIEASGTADYVKSFETFSEYRQDADKIMNEIASVIQPGQILSFSTASRGHTGIISAKGDQWTFVNSGILDNNIGVAAPYKGVGEESLVSEIHNWIKLAARKNEPLILTLGHLDENKLEKYKIIPWGA